MKASRIARTRIPPHAPGIVREHNVYRWAGNLLTELSEIRVEENELAAKQP